MPKAPSSTAGRATCWPCTSKPACWSAAGKALTNFAAQLPAPHSDLARETLKDPYRFDFLGLNREANEREIENALVTACHRISAGAGRGICIRRAAGAAGSGRRRLFHRPAVLSSETALLCGDRAQGRQVQTRASGPAGLLPHGRGCQIKATQDAPTIGLLLCKSKNKVVAEYALRDNAKPMGVAEYQAARILACRTANQPAQHRADRAGAG